MLGPQLICLQKAIMITTIHKKAISGHLASFSMKCSQGLFQSSGEEVSTTTLGISKNMKKQLKS